MKKYRKTILILTMMMSVTTFSILARNQQEGIFKNVQVFPKNISQERMDKEMQLFSTSLGVNCEYCHVRKDNVWDFASDDKGQKKEARHMMIMTNEINAKYFGVDLEKTTTYTVMNCYTCHRGEEFPVIEWDSTGVKPKPLAVPTSPWGSYKN